MRIKLRTIEDGGRGACRFGVSCFSCMAFATYLLTTNSTDAQETLTIGARAPAIEVNENAVHYNAPVGLGSEKELPLFNPVEDNLKSRIIDLRALNRYRPLSRSIDKPSTFERNKIPESRVVELPSIQRPPVPIDVTSKVVDTPSLNTQSPQATYSQEDSLTVDINTAAIAPPSKEVPPSTVNVSQDLSGPPSPGAGDIETLVPSPPAELQPMPDKHEKPELAAIAPTPIIISANVPTNSATMALPFMMLSPSCVTRKADLRDGESREFKPGRSINQSRWCQTKS